jgi:hypothetical protein
MMMSSMVEMLGAMPDQFERAFALVPHDALRWTPESWEGIPGETFSAIGQACHIRDIERDGYHVRIQRMLDEDHPDLVSLDGYALAVERRYDDADPTAALREFRDARAQTIALLARVTNADLRRTGTFAEYGTISLAGLIHFLGSHDQQHLACMQWLLGKIASRA